jgi:hypothetical protein
LYADFFLPLKHKRQNGQDIVNMVACFLRASMLYKRSGFIFSEAASSVLANLYA